MKILNIFALLLLLLAVVATSVFFVKAAPTITYQAPDDTTSMGSAQIINPFPNYAGDTIFSGSSQQKGFKCSIDPPTFQLETPVAGSTLTACILYEKVSPALFACAAVSTSTIKVYSSATMAAHSTPSITVPDSLVVNTYSGFHIPWDSNIAWLSDFASPSTRLIKFDMSTLTSAGTITTIANWGAGIVSSSTHLFMQHDIGQMTRLVLATDTEQGSLPTTTYEVGISSHRSMVYDGESELLFASWVNGGESRLTKWTATASAFTRVEVFVMGFARLVKINGFAILLAGISGDKTMKLVDISTSTMSVLSTSAVVADNINGIILVPSTSSTTRTCYGFSVTSSKVFRFTIDLTGGATSPVTPAPPTPAPPTPAPPTTTATVSATTASSVVGSGSSSSSNSTTAAAATTTSAVPSNTTASPSSSGNIEKVLMNVFCTFLSLVVVMTF